MRFVLGDDAFLTEVFYFHSIKISREQIVGGRSIIDRHADEFEIHDSSKQFKFNVRGYGNFVGRLSLSDRLLTPD